MKVIQPNRIYSLLAIVCTLSVFAYSQANEICAESGFKPTFDSPFAHVPYVFGKISFVDLKADESFPATTISLFGGQRTERQRINESGNYCFRLNNASSTLVIEVNGIEVTRRSIAIPQGQMREDFTLSLNSKTNTAGVVSAKFYRPVNPETLELYKKTAEAEKQKNTEEATNFLQEIVKKDPRDFIAWAKLGFLRQLEKNYDKAIEAYKAALSIEIEYTPAWINVARIRIDQKQYEAAIAVLNHVLEFEAKSAEIYELLGTAYLLNKQGSLGAEALNKAIELDPIGAAECHLQLAHLYRLAKQNRLASKEYRLFLAKVPDYKDRKKLKAFIQDNPEN
ncbi:MAG: tetratricopeptide repeat protein [Pyrinomonadaceae bacterium]